MIKDRLVNSQVYESLSENIKKGFQWLRETNLKEIEPGKYVIDGENLWANVQIYETKPDADYEAHKKYIDIQYMISGNELVGVRDLSDCVSAIAYNRDNDIEFLHAKTEEEFQELNEGKFLLFYPHDAHKPSINPGETKTVKKVVVKALFN